MAEINETNNKVILTESAVKQLIGNIKDADSALQTTIRDNIIGTTADQIISSDSANYNFSLNGIKNYIDNLEAGPFGNISDGSEYIASIKQVNGKIEATTASAVSTYFVGNVQTHEPANILSTLPTSNKAITEALTSISATWAVDPQVPGEYISGISQQNARISNINLSPFNPYLVTENTLSETTPTQSFKVNVGGATGTTSVLLKHATTETYGVVKLSNEISNNNPNAITSQAVQNYSQPRHIVLENKTIPKLGKTPQNDAETLLRNIRLFVNYIPVRITITKNSSAVYVTYKIEQYIPSGVTFATINSYPSEESDLYENSLLSENGEFYNFSSTLQTRRETWGSWGEAISESSSGNDEYYYGAFLGVLPSGSQQIDSSDSPIDTSVGALIYIKDIYTDLSQDKDLKIFNFAHTNEGTSVYDPEGGTSGSLDRVLSVPFSKNLYSNNFYPLPTQIISFAGEIKNGKTFIFTHTDINSNSTLIVSPATDDDWIIWRDKGVRGYQENNKLIFTSDEGTEQITKVNIIILNNPLEEI